MHADTMILTSVAWIGTYLVHSTLFLGTAWLLTRQRLLRAPRLSERVWRLALFGGLLTASLQLVGGTRPAWATWILEADPSSSSIQDLVQTTLLGKAEVEDQERPLPISRQASQTPSGAFDQAVTQPIELQRAEAKPQAISDWSSIMPDGELEPGDQHASNSVFEVETTRPSLDAASARSALQAITPRDEARLALGSSAPARSAGARLPWKYLVLCAWIGAGSLGLMGFLWACSCLIARMSRRRRIVHGPLLEQLDELRRAAGLKHEVQLFASASLDGPITYGWVRPRICLPLRAISELNPAQQHSLLAHEMAHVMRRDPLWFSLYTLMVRVLCMQPLNRLARRELLESAELLCDDWAVRWTGQRLGLASCLTEIAQWILCERRPALISAGMAEQPSRLGVRVERLLDDRRSPQPEPRHAWWTPTALGMLVLFTSAAPGFSSTEPSSARELEAEDSASEELRDFAIELEPAPLELTTANSKAPQPPAPPVHVHQPPARVVQAPAPSAPERAAHPLALELGLERGMLEEELNLLQLELDSVRIELAGSGQEARFQPALQATEARIQTLRQYQERLDRLLFLTQQTSTHPLASNPVSK